MRATNACRTSVAYNNQHLFSSCVCGLSRGLLIQTGLSQVALFHLYPILFGKGGQEESILFIGVAEAKESQLRCSRARQPIGRATLTKISLAKVNPAKLKVKLWGSASHP